MEELFALSSTGSGGVVSDNKDKKILTTFKGGTAFDR